MNEILDILNDDEQEGDVFMDPPDVRELTDVDSDDTEDESSHCSASHLSGNQLAASARIQHAKSLRRIDTVEYNDELVHTAVTKYRKTELGQFKWSKKQHMMVTVPMFPEQNSSPYMDMSARQLFELFFDDELFALIERESNCTVCKSISEVIVLKEMN